MSLPTAKIICDSMAPNGVRLTTMEVKMHRFVLSEFNTHRMFSRNSASSRAIPVSKMLERVKTDPAMPLYWGRNQAGMQAAEELTLEKIEVAKKLWLAARDNAVNTVESLHNLGLHKQLVNRLLEPWLWHYAIVSSTEWTNAFAQRCHKDAQPEARTLFMAIQHVYYNSEPTYIVEHSWHLPYITEIDRHELTIENQIRISIARCARVSYLSHDGFRDIEKDLELYNKLASAAPMHASPFEHVATPLFLGQEFSGNFKGWKQFRKLIPNENIESFVPIKYDSKTT